jgi:hypothetical protein
MGCPRGSAPAPGPATPPKAGAASAAVKKKERPATPRYTKDRIRNLRTIFALWNAINHHHDQLGQALALLEPRPQPYDVLGRPPRRALPRPPGRRPPARRPPARRPPARRPAERPRPREARRLAPPRARWAQRAAPGRRRVCQRACRHVRAICYAADRICQIADRLADWPSAQACIRGRNRCTDARNVSLRRCHRCSR